MFAEVPDVFWAGPVVSIVFSVGRLFPVESIVRRKSAELFQLEKNKRIALQYISSLWVCVERRVKSDLFGRTVDTVMLEECEPCMDGGYHLIGGCRLEFENCRIPFGAIAYLRFKADDELQITSSSPWGNLLVPVQLRWSRDLEHTLLQARN